MISKGMFQLSVIAVVPANLVAEGEQIYEALMKWMAETHPRTGDKALLHYSLTQGPELSNPMDITSPPSGNTCFGWSEVYASRAGLENHFALGAQWKEVPRLMAWAS